MWGSRLLLALVVVVLAVLGAGVYRAWTYEGTWKTVGALDSLQPDSVTYLEDHRVFVVVEGRRVEALSAIDPHLGHRDLYCESSELFESPAHGEKFDKWGVYFAGPAPRGLDHVAVRINDGVVEIDPFAITEGAPRPARGSEDSHALEPVGPFCMSGEGRAGFYAVPND